MFLGRRCATGEGIYAFKCRRAEQLFNTLLRCIHSRNHNNESVLESFSLEPPSCPPGTLPRPLPDSFNLVPSHSQSDYLEPAPTNFAQNSRFSGFNSVRLGSVSSGPLSPEVHSPGSPSSVNILEVMPLAPLPQAGAQVTNVYQMHDFPQQREHNNNKKFKLDSITHSYSNTGDVNTDLVSLRPSLQAQKFTPSDDEHIPNLLNEQVATGDTAPLSPTLSTASEPYATLNMLDMNNRLYMNLAPGEVSNVLPAIREEISNHSNNFQNFFLMNNLQTPKTNFNFVDISKIEIDEEKHNYANLGPGEVNYDPRLLQKNKATRGIILENNMSDVPQDATAKINYAVLDLDKANEEMTDGIQGLPPNSPKKPAVGYTIIDFNKTEALTSVALGTEVDMEGSRKTRHNSTALPPSPTA